VTQLSRHEWRVASIPRHGEAVNLIQLCHYAGGAPNTSTYRHGLYRNADGEVLAHAWGVALWIPPTRTAAESVAGDDWQGVLALSRLVVHPDVPANGASFLLGRSMRLIDRARWPVLLTYADTAQGHTGAIYRATNWTCLGTTPGGDVWLDRYGRQTTRKKGRRTLTAAQMTADGCTRQPSLPKVKFVHRVRVDDLAKILEAL
jgi:hypothetical protein